LFQEKTSRDRVILAGGEMTSAPQVEYIGETMDDGRWTKLKG
jgi:hypothetical protein